MPREDILERFAHLVAAGHTLCLWQKKRSIKIYTLRKK